MNYNQGVRCLAAATTLTAALVTLPVRAQEQEPERAPGCYLAGGIDAFQNGNLTLAENEFRGAVKASSGSPEARENLAITLAREGKLDEAVAEFGTILVDRPELVRGQLQSGIAASR